MIRNRARARGDARVALVVTAAVALVAGVAVTARQARRDAQAPRTGERPGQPSAAGDHRQVHAAEPRHQGRGDVSPDRDDVRQYAAHAAPERQRARRLLRHGRHRRPQSVLPLAKAGYVADLSKQPWVKTFPLAPANRPLYWRRGVLTALPFDVVPVGVMYNTEVMAGLGLEPPKTQKHSSLRAARPRRRASTFSTWPARRHRTRRSSPRSSRRAPFSRRIRPGTSSASRARRRSRARRHGASRCSASST